MAMTVLSVSQLVRYSKSLLEADARLKEVYVRGEIINVSDHYASGHIYFSLKDASSTIHAVCFRPNAQHLRFRPLNGMAVIARGSAALYERDAMLQIYVSELLPDGPGAFGLAFEKLKAKLNEQGLFDSSRKTPLPQYIKTVGIVTSPTGAALKDIISVFQRRSAGLFVKISPATVQGKDAAASIISALNLLKKEPCDVVIVCRGGGSSEDLWVFNDESLVMAVSKYETPIISAIGHEIDYTLCDLAADIRAATPTAAAEIITDTLENNRISCERHKADLARAIEQYIATKEHNLRTLNLHPLFMHPTAIIDNRLQQLYNYEERLNALPNANFNAISNAIKNKAALLDSLSPLKVLTRGYSITLINNHPLVSAENVHIGQEITSKLSQGSLKSTIIEIIKED